MSVVTRFAPSPTGSLHIGSARTALFNYLFARKNGGKFFLRIEDTDKERSSSDAVNTIISSMQWLGLDYDHEVVYQSARKLRHQEVAHKLIENNKAYLCFSSQEEINTLRTKAISRRQHFIFNSPWRDAIPNIYPKSIKPVVRLKVPRYGVTTVKDLLQDNVKVNNSQLDDMILLRSDGSPTYMLAVVVDDHDMGITHIIRGDDHLNNTHRQQVLYEALGYQVPSMIHIPLVHDCNGKKLSKRYDAISVESFKEMGYLPEALCNYLLRLGWSYGNNEIISREQAIKWFSIKGLGKSAAKLDFAKMKNLNAYYLRQKTDLELTKTVTDLITEKYTISTVSKDNILKAMSSLKLRAELLTELKEMAMMYVVDFPVYVDEEAKQVILKVSDNLLKEIRTSLSSLDNFSKDSIQKRLKFLAESSNVKFSELMYFIRAFIAGSIKSPSLFEMMSILGLKHSLDRLKK